MTHGAAPRAVRVILADDHRLARAGFRMLLEDIPGVEVIAEADDGEELVRLAETMEADIVFTDVEMPKMDGIAAIEHLVKSRPGIKCVVISMHDEVGTIRQAAAKGAVGYVMKQASAQDLRAAIESVLARGSYFSPAVAALLLAPAPPGPEDVLTERQLEIVKMYASGMATKEIAYKLDLSTKTVDAHRARIMERLEMSDIASLTRYAIRNGLVKV